MMPIMRPKIPPNAKPRSARVKLICKCVANSPDWTSSNETSND